MFLKNNIKRNPFIPWDTLSRNHNFLKTNVRDNSLMRKNTDMQKNILLYYKTCRLQI